MIFFFQNKSAPSQPVVFFSQQIISALATSQLVVFFSHQISSSQLIGNRTEHGKEAEAD
jgi:hypothetical protein